MAGAEDSSTLTQEGTMIGTLDYVAPEQARDSHAVDIRTDLYSLGCTFYYLLTGQVPFPGGEALEKLYKHGFEQPTSVERLRPEVPPSVAAVVRKLMAKRPEDRFQTPAELAEVLVAGTGARPGARFWCWPVSKRLLVSAALGCLLLGGLILYRMTGTHSAAPIAPPSQPRSETAFANSIDMKLIGIAPGKFLMGSTSEEYLRYEKAAHGPGSPPWEIREVPQHEVKITKGFYMGVYPVTQGQYFKVTGKNPSDHKTSPDHPVEQVTWDNAVKFCQKLSDLPEERKAGRVYRLPTEAEWECACRAGTTTAFHCGNSLSFRQANFNGEQPFGNAEKGPRATRTVMVGSYPANAWGLQDMHGNVSQWCLDGARLYTDGAAEDPRGPETEGGHRVIRGGSWGFGAWDCRATLRKQRSSSQHNTDNTGFRVVCER
jgi:formylglycine-generating enzyme required for sulfatase activity